MESLHRRTKGAPRGPSTVLAGMSRAERAEWRDALREIVRDHGGHAAAALLEELAESLRQRGEPTPRFFESGYVNTIAVDEEPSYPGDLETESRIEGLVRWNAMAMVVRANRDHPGIGGHISTFASTATLVEVALNHFIQARDLTYYQGHASPGLYARAFLEGRLDEEHLLRFRREVSGPGLSSYPHPWLMPNFWSHPTVSMGLGPLMAIHQARLLRYLAHRGLGDVLGRRVWCFVGDGECDEPEALSALSLAAREELDNLIFVVNGNLQRLDGPVRGNDKILQELERRFAAAGWQVLKVLWGRPWDPIFARDDGRLVARLNEMVDGTLQRLAAEGGAAVRATIFEGLEHLVEGMTDDDLATLTRGGHDPVKIHAAYDLALRTRGVPSVILAQTVKGWGLGEAGEASMVTHQQKKLEKEALGAFRDRFGIRVNDSLLDSLPFVPLDEKSLRYLKERRSALGGPVPQRHEAAEPIAAPSLDVAGDLLEGSAGRPASTTGAFVRLLGKLLADDEIGPRVVPIVPDEARTFGLEALFRKYGIYAAGGQRYDPVDKGSLAFYRESQRGQILEEGITEAGAMADFIAAGTAQAGAGLDLIPMYAFYSMFGFQRVGDLIWAAGDARARGFLLGATAGRTTLNGEGLQHQDGHSQLFATAVPNLESYDPAFAYEVAVIVQDGLRRMLEKREPVIFYLTLYNESYPMPALPTDAREGILRGMYRLDRGEGEGPRPHLLASGPLVPEALRAQALLADRFGVPSDVWSVTSWSELRREAAHVERHNRLNPGARRKSHLERLGATMRGPIVAVSDYLRLVPEQLARWLPGPFWSLGTDGYGRSDTREILRHFFEISAEHVAYTALCALHPDREDAGWLAEARDELGIDPHLPDPAFA
jgi:pyruvate dehydrogenase E1 component